MTDYAFIGDVHSDITELDQILEIIPSSYRLVFLGDLFDYRKPTGKGDSLDVYNLVRSIPQAVVLRSNHQQKLLSYLKGKPVKGNAAFQNTLYDFQLPGNKYREELKDWLEAQPYALALKSNGRQYRAAHAYYPAGFNFQSVSLEHKNACLYGLKDNPHWWEQPHYEPYIKVCGHHHTIFTSSHSVVVDGMCGAHSEGCLVAYLSDTQTLVSTKPLKRVELPAYTYSYPATLTPRNLKRLS
jgi:hypothetical protein